MIFNMAGGGASGWTEVTSSFVCEDGETPVSQYANNFVAFSNGSLVYLTMNDVDFGTTGMITMIDEKLAPTITDIVGLVMILGGEMTPVHYENGGLYPEIMDYVYGTIIYPIGDVDY